MKSTSLVAGNGRETFGSFITIVGPVFYNRDLSANAKLLYGLLSAMSQAPKYYAYARNETMQAYLQCSERALQRYLKELQDAGEIRIEDGQGGRTLRKIYLTRVQPFYPDKSDGVNPDKSDGVDIYSNNKQKKKSKGAAGTDVIEWLDRWVVSFDWPNTEDLEPEEQQKLIGDIHGFVENRAAKKKPILTVRAAGMLTNRLDSYSDGYQPKIPAMRYMLQEATAHNWEKVFPIQNADDFTDFLRREYTAGSAYTEGGADGWD